MWTQVAYHIAGKVGGELNLVDHWNWSATATLSSAKLNRAQDKWSGHEPSFFLSKRLCDGGGMQ